MKLFLFKKYKGIYTWFILLHWFFFILILASSGAGFANGTIKTLFTGSIMEARGKNDEPSATNSWKDAASASGRIKTFQKSFGYESGVSG